MTELAQERFDRALAILTATYGPGTIIALEDDYHAWVRGKPSLSSAAEDHCCLIDPILPDDLYELQLLGWSFLRTSDTIYGFWVPYLCNSAIILPRVEV